MCGAERRARLNTLRRGIGAQREVVESVHGGQVCEIEVRHDENVLNAVDVDGLCELLRGGNDDERAAGSRDGLGILEQPPAGLLALHGSEVGLQVARAGGVGLQRGRTARGAAQGRQER